MNPRRFLLVTNIFLVAMAIWMIVRIVLSWSLPEQKPGPDQPLRQENSEQAPGGEAGKPTPEDYREIVEKDLFKTVKDASEAQRQEAPKPEADLKITELNLTLKGTVVGENEGSYAVIMEGDKGSEELFYLNDFVMGARIVQILKDKVIINLNGKEEALLLSYEGRPPSAPPAQKRAAPVRRVPPPRSPRR